MGTKTEPLPEPDPVPAGTQCDNCWAQGKPFEDRETPSKLIVTFSGIQKSEDWQDGDGEPLNGTYILEQEAGFPCNYYLFGYEYVVHVKFKADTVFAGLADENILEHFSGESLSACELFIINSLDEKFVNGTAKITIPETT